MFWRDAQLRASLQGELHNRASTSTDSTSFFCIMLGAAFDASRARMTASERIRRTRQAIDRSVVGDVNSSAGSWCASSTQHANEDLKVILSDEDDEETTMEANTVEESK